MHTKLTIWDEIVLTHRHSLETVDKTLKGLLCSVLPLAEFLTPCIGDFRQILPVVLAANCSQMVSAYFNRSRLFPLFKRLFLHGYMRICGCRHCITTQMPLQALYNSHLIYYALEKGTSIRREAIRFSTNPRYKVSMRGRNDVASFSRCREKL